MSHNSSPNNVPGANKGEAVSVAAPGLVGAGGTNLRDILSILVRMPEFRLCMAVNLVVLMVLVSNFVLPGLIAQTPFAVVEDWGDFMRFAFRFWFGLEQRA